MKRFIVLFISLLLMATTSVYAQEKKDDISKEGELFKFINPESKDVITKLEVVQQTLYETEQKTINLTFIQLYGHKIKFERILYANYDGDLTPGYVFSPIQLNKGKKYPGLVVVHGGYHGHFEENYFGLMERAVNEGYIVIFPEYRGSRGYGAKHYNAIDYGGEEVSDVLAAADYLAERRSYVDGSKVGILGRSHGGMIALLAIERAPKKFKAAVDVVGLTDFVAYMSYKPEYRRQDVAKQKRFGGIPFENLGAYMDVSPINHVDKIETPLLIHSTTGDKIVPIQLHTQRLIDALKARGKTFEYEIYDNAPGGHIYSHGDTKESKDSYDKIFKFLAKYLKP